MSLLLDTHVWLWLQAEPERLSDEALLALEDDRNELHLSAASTWEIAIKYELGRLALPEPPATYVPSRLQRQGVVGMPIEHRHAVAVASLPRYHRDPFDRMLVAQAQTEGMMIVTVDPAFDDYDVDLLRAN